MDSFLLTIIELEQWVIDHYQIISFLFGLFAAVGVGAGIIYKIAIVLRNARIDREAYRERLNNQLTELAHQAALFDQRQEFQSEFMSYQEKRYNESREENRNYGKAMVDNAIDSAVCRKILEDNNIRAYCGQ